MTIATSAMASVASRFEQARIQPIARADLGDEARSAICALRRAGSSACGCARATTEPGSPCRTFCSDVSGASIAVGLKNDREQSEDRHIEAELGDRRMAEHLAE